MKAHPKVYLGVVGFVSLSLLAFAFLAGGVAGAGLVMSLTLIGACLAYLLTQYTSADLRPVDRGVFIDKSNRDYLAGLMAGLNTVRDIPNLVIDASGTIYGVNQRAQELLDCSVDDLVGQPIEDISSDLAEKVLNYFELCRVGNVRSPIAVQCGVAGRSFSLHMQAIENDRTGEKWVRVTISQAAPSGAIGSASLETLGRFSAGIAHDLNNLLGSIVGSVGILQRRFGDAAGGEREQKLIDTIAGAARRGSRLAQDLMDFGKTTSGSLAGRNVQLSGVVDDAIEVCRNMADVNRCRTVKSVSSDLWVFATEEGLHQILVNLLFNAIDAMPEGGDILISAGKEGESSIWVDVVDSGVGMSEEVAQKAFEPFFSTKKQMQGNGYLGGSGLGLANARIILDAWGGSITLTSKVGAGSTFRLFLKAADVSLDEALVH